MDSAAEIPLREMNYLRSMTGKVYKSTGSWYVVKTAEGDVWNARLKGIFKLDEITSALEGTVNGLLPFQVRGFNFLRDLPRGGIAQWSTGTGKL